MQPSSCLVLDCLTGRRRASKPPKERQNPRSAYQDDQGWHRETVDSDGDLGGWSSLAIDGEGHLHVAYYDATNRTLKYATLLRPGGSGW